MVVLLLCRDVPAAMTCCLSRFPVMVPRCSAAQVREETPELDPEINHVRIMWAKPWVRNEVGETVLSDASWAEKC